MYRALTWWLLSRGLDTTDPGTVARHAGEPLIEVGTDPDAPAIAVDGVDVSGPIRTRSEERRVGKECRARSWRYHRNKYHSTHRRSRQRVAWPAENTSVHAE